MPKSLVKGTKLVGKNEDDEAIHYFTNFCYGSNVVRKKVTVLENTNRLNVMNSYNMKMRQRLYSMDDGMLF